VVDDESLFPEIYTDNLRNEKLRIVPFKADQASDSYESKVNPNPFTESTTLEITIPVGEEFTVTLYDMKGQELSNRKYVSYTSKAEVQIGSDIIPLPGLYYYKVKCSIGELSGKFVRQ
jgi:hypothetical protein